MRTGLELLEISKGHSEPYVDEAYEKEHVVITDNIQDLNQLMAANRGLQDLITAYKVCGEQDDVAACSRHIQQMIPLLSISGMNHSELACYWPVLDVSYSMFDGFSQKLKIDFLKQAVEKYIENRHGIYQLHGYTFTTLQVQSDSFAHKRNGPSGGRKIAEMMGVHGLSYIADAELLKNREQFVYSFPDSHPSVLDRALQIWNADFAWRDEHEGKIPDFIIAANGHLYIGEHKHIKESGGGQDKQMLELIGLIGHDETDSDVHYVSFLDGVMFNKVVNATRDGKTLEHQRSIRERLARIPHNYFLNTFGFHSLLIALAGE
jgi:hypothetical protein